MSRTIRARFANGVIEPLEKLDIEEGEEITVTIAKVSRRGKKRGVSSKEEDPLEATAGGWHGLIDAEQLKKDIYAARLISTRPGVRL